MVLELSRETEVDAHGHRESTRSTDIHSSPERRTSVETTPGSSPRETESVGAAQPRPEVLLPPPPLPQLTSTDKERDVTPLTSAPTSDSAPARVPESPVANRMPPRETVVPRIVASPVRRSTRVAKAPVKLNL